MKRPRVGKNEAICAAEGGGRLGVLVLSSRKPPGAWLVAAVVVKLRMDEAVRFPAESVDTARK